MLLASGSLPAGPDWALELKWDGCRAQLRYDGSRVSLRTRNGRECVADFPELTEISSALGSRRVILDGELVCLRPDGRPDFALLRRRLVGDRRRASPVTLQVFDVLHLDGCSTRALPYRERRALLEELHLHGPAWRTPRILPADDHSAFLSRLEELGLEGAVAKRLDSRYAPGRRSRAWVKHKLRRHEHLLVTGVRRTSEGVTEMVFVARRRADGSVTGAGSIELGVRGELVEQLEGRLRGLPMRRRGSVTWYPAEVSVVASVHGLPDSPVRDAILREVVEPDPAAQLSRA
jgi:bifunctional non-homologous end joining protein LigD